jgi:hypothetical protein
MTVSAEILEAAVDALRARRPDMPALDQRARSRLAEVLDDPSGQSWMEPAGLLDGDSCGYPVEGGYYDVRSDLGANPATADPEVREAVLAQLVQEWADDYVLTGRARLDRSWLTHLDAGSRTT